MSSGADALQTAIGLHQAGQLAEAEKLYRRILDENPWHPDALHLVGVVAGQRGDYDTAIQYIGQALVANPQNAAFHYNLGEAYRELGYAAEARNCYQLALTLDPSFERAQRQLARLPGEAESSAAGQGLAAEPAGAANTPILCVNASHRHRCIFIHIPKNAGSSIKRAFDMPGGGHFPWRHYAAKFPQLWRQYRSFAVVRNPWDRLVSAYHHARMKKSHWQNEQTGLHVDYELLVDKSFAECVSILFHEGRRLNHASWAPQAMFLLGPELTGRTVMVDELLRFEDLAEDFAGLCRKLNIEGVELATINDSQRARDYRSYYDDKTRSMVAQLYRVDIETFGYSF